MKLGTWSHRAADDVIDTSSPAWFRVGSNFSSEKKFVDTFYLHNNIIIASIITNQNADCQRACI